MLRKTLFLALAAILGALVMSTEAQAWGCYHYSYHSGGYGGGGYHYHYNAPGFGGRGGGGGGYHYGGYGGGGSAHYGYHRSW